jgi:hypothetical protein
MSFDVFLQRFDEGASSKVDLQKVRAVLDAIQFKGPDEFGFYRVQFPDGNAVEFSAEGLDGSAEFNSCAFHIRGLSHDLAKFIFEIAKAADLVILPAMEDFVPILSAAKQRRTLPADLLKRSRPAVLCKSPSELEALLSRGYSGWKKYRNQVIKKKT